MVTNMSKQMYMHDGMTIRISSPLGVIDGIHKTLITYADTRSKGNPTIEVPTNSIETIDVPFEMGDELICIKELKTPPLKLEKGLTYVVTWNSILEGGTHVTMIDLLEQDYKGESAQGAFMNMERMEEYFELKETSQ